VGLISSFVVPAVLLALTALAAGAGEPLPGEVAAFLSVYPWVALAAGVALGLRFRRGRVVFALLAIALADRLLLRFGSGAVGEDVARWVLSATAVLLPLDLAWLCLARERGTFTPDGFLRACALAVQPAVASFVWLSYRPRLAAVLARPAGGGPAIRIPTAAAAAFLIALAAVAVAAARRRKPLEIGFGWAIVACFLALESAGHATLWFATADLILIAALLENTFVMAFRDALTSLPSRRAFDEAVEKLAGPYVVAMVDIDHFKAVNDRYGHDVGDQVLRMVATRLADAGHGSRAYRVGGEEFALVYTHRPLKEVLGDLEHLRETIAGSAFALRAPDRPARKPKQATPRRAVPDQIAVTVSIGVASSERCVDGPAGVVRAADAALYKAKAASRNCVRG